jgi:hypothetical protein
MSQHPADDRELCCSTESVKIVGASKTDLGSSKGPTKKYNVIFTNIARELIVL